MNNSKISIITVSYNVAKTIEQTILSVVEQTYSNIEYIIIDGGSTDGTVDIIKKYADRIAYWVSEPDKGIYDAMNKGIDVATGEWVYFLGADDCLIEENIIKKILPNFDESISVLSGAVWIVNKLFRLQHTYSNRFTIQDIYDGYCIPHQGLFVKTYLLKKRKFDCRYKIVADYDSFLCLYFDDKVVFRYIDDKIAFFSDDGCSSTAIKQRVTEDIEVMVKHKIPIKYVKKYQEKYDISIKNLFKDYIKSVLNRWGCLRYVLLLKGWTSHSCEWQKCYWCDRH